MADLPVSIRELLARHFDSAESVDVLCSAATMIFESARRSIAAFRYAPVDEAMRERMRHRNAAHVLEVFYVIRLIAFLMIIAAIVVKNRRG